MNHRRVVLSLLDSPAYGGAEAYLLSHIKHIVGMGYDVVVATNNQTVCDQYLRQLRAHERSHVRIIRLPYVLDAIGNWKGLVKFFVAAPGALWWIVTTVRRLSQSSSEVTCYLAGFSDRLLFSPVLRRLGCRIIWIEIGPLEPTFAKNWGFPKLLYQLTQGSAHAITTTSRFTKRSIIRSTRFDPADISLIYPEVIQWSDRERLRFRHEGMRWRTEHGLSRCRMACVVGRLAKENEIDGVIRAIALTRGVTLLIVGDGPERAALEALSHNMGLSERVRFVGFVGEAVKFALLAAADVFVFPRAWDLDGFGMTTIEAMSVGTPVITTDFGPQREIVSHRVNGMRYRPHDPEDLAKTIAAFFALPIRVRSKMGRRGRAGLTRFSALKTRWHLNRLLCRKFGDS